MQESHLFIFIISTVILISCSDSETTVSEKENGEPQFWLEQVVSDWEEEYLDTYLKAALIDIPTDFRQELRQQFETRRNEFIEFAKKHDIAILATDSNRDVVAELWDISIDDNELTASFLLKTTSSRHITGGGSGTMLPNHLVHTDGIIEGNGIGVRQQGAASL